MTAGFYKCSLMKPQSKNRDLGFFPHFLWKFIPVLFLNITEWWYFASGMPGEPGCRNEALSGYTCMGAETATNHCERRQFW